MLARDSLCFICDNRRFKIFSGRRVSSILVRLYFLGKQLVYKKVRYFEYTDDSFTEKEPHLKHSINGYIFANLPDLDMDKDDRVRWHLIGMGNEVDLHTPHWHGTLVKINGQYTDVAELLPASMKSADMLADNPGQWMFHCHVADHITAGMTSMYRVH
jgi:FtsP/CotA-like multicopper oxidase with cupredoxin domain